MIQTKGIHHITAITADPQKNLDFYEGFLGQRLVKKTVNFDDPNAYHLYYGDAVGSPGTIMTFFYWAGMRSGVRGSGEVNSVYYTIRPTSLDFWKARADEFGVVYTQNILPFGETVLMMVDPDGLVIGLTVSEVETNIVPWTAGPIPPAHVLGGFYGALLALPKDRPIGPVLEEGLGYSVVETKEAVTRYQATDWPGKFLATTEHADSQKASQGAGSVHHIAFQAATDNELLTLTDQVHDIGLGSTQVIDRQYFHSTYFMTPAMILFELATNDIGFAMDEDPAELGQNLKLPTQYESRRSEITAMLTPLTLPRNT